MEQLVLDPQGKKCGRCLELKPWSEFGRHKRSKDRYQWACRPCQRGFSSGHYYEKRRSELETAASIVKLCRDCEQEKPLVEFSVDKRAPDGRKRVCKACHKVARDAWRKSLSKEVQDQYRHRHWLKKQYGLTPEQYQEMLAAQNGLCATCGTDRPGGREGRRFTVDHDHATGQVRGLLCVRCNTALGQVNDSVELLETLIAYVRKYRLRDVV